MDILAKIFAAILGHLRHLSMQVLVAVPTSLCVAFATQSFFPEVVAPVKTEQTAMVEHAEAPAEKLVLVAPPNADAAPAARVVRPNESKTAEAAIVIAELPPLETGFDAGPAPKVRLIDRIFGGPRGPSKAAYEPPAPIPDAETVKH